MKTNNFISIIIPTRNRSAYLADAIESIYENNTPIDEYEVLVIDNGSTDEASLLCNTLVKKYSNLKYFLEPKNGLHYGRHKGLLESKGEILIFIDDDVLVSKSWIKTYLEVFEKDQKTVLAGGNDLPKFEGEIPVWVESLWKNISCGKYLSEYSLIDFNIPAQEFSPYFIYGCNFAIRKKFLLECKGFHPDGFSKENILLRGDGESYISDQVIALGMKAFFHPEAFVYHRVPAERLTEAYLNSRQYSQGISYNYRELRKKKSISYVEFFILLTKYKVGRIRASFISTILFRKMKLAFYDGAITHLKAYNQQTSLQNWVHQENYLEDKN